MTIEELIQELEKLSYEHGPHIEVMKRRVHVADGSTQFMPIKSVRLEDSDEDPCNWTISL